MLVDGYVRVSATKGRSGDRFISPAVQREQIEGWAKLRGVALGNMYEELDESGGRRDRPMLLEALSRIEDGQSGGLVVAKMDRFGRSLIDGLGAIDRIEKAGGTFVSVADGLDLQTPTGKLVLRILLSMAEWELERIRDQWDIATARAIARGMHLASVAPAGYKRGKDGRLRVDPVSGPIIREAFMRRAAGQSLRSLANWLTDSEAVSGFGNAGWAEGTVRQMIARTTYLGEVRKGRHVNPGAHEPLVAATVWQQAQAPVRPAVKATAHPTLLGSLLRCAGCRMVMHATWRHMPDLPNTAVYACGAQSSAGRCPSPASITGTMIEPYIAEVAFRLARGRGPRDASKASSGRLEKQLATAESELVSYRDHPTILSTIGADAYGLGLVKRQQKVERARLSLGALQRRRATPDAVPEDLAAAWPSMTLDERRASLHELIDVVFVERGRLRAHERAYICRRGEGPTDLPGKGRRVGTIRSFDPLECEVLAQPARPGKAATWSNRRIKGELTRFIANRSVWPATDEFYAAGHFALHQQVLGTGGPGLWATRLGVKYNLHPSIPAWTDQRLTAAIAPFLRGKIVWPQRAEFEAVGLGLAYQAMAQRGGARKWASTFGVPFAGNGRLRWTHESIEVALVAFLEESAYYPPAREFHAAGLSSLYFAICRHGGQDAWAARVGLSRVR